MRRFVSLAFLLFFTIPFGASIAGCGNKVAVQYCSGGSTGPVVGQAKSITLSPSFATYGESLDYGTIGSGLSASAVDCKGNAVSVARYTYASSDATRTYADINPGTGQVCAGTFNRFTGGGIGDYTICNPPAPPPVTSPLTPLVAYVTATADGAVSNAIPVYVHPKVTGILIGNKSGSCSADPDTTCCPITSGTVATGSPYLGTSCLSQGQSAQLIGRAFAGSTNITCQIGHVQYSAQNSSIFTVDQNGVVTANQPGSTIVTANVTNSGTGGAAGFFATCPPASIVLSVPNQPSGTSSIAVGVNTTQQLTATVTDTQQKIITGVALTFSSTTPSTIAPGGGLVNPTFPGAATITAACQPPTCNAAPFSQIGLYGNGKPVTSNGLQVTAAGINSTVLYVGSTQSQYLFPIDFSTNQTGTLLKLPYIPNSMVITNDGSTIYLGSSSALMTVAAANNTVTGANIAITGTVLAVSPDGSTVVVSDPFRQTVSLVSNGTVVSTYGGTGTRAQWSPDSQTVYITATNHTLLVHSAFTGWTSIPTANQYLDVAVLVPNIGAFFATADPITEGRTYCPLTTGLTAGNPPVATNTYYPVATDTAFKGERIAVTNDSAHVLEATATTATLNDIALALPPPATPTGPFACTTATGAVTFSTSVTPHPLTGTAPTAITGVFPASDSGVAFVTYTGTSGLLPLYAPGTGTLSTVALSNGATAPVYGVFSTDNKTFFAGTSGDNQVHLITVTGPTAADTSVIAPKLPDANGNLAVPNLLVQRLKKSTS